MSPIERYLDDMFDRLTGTGNAGRRVLDEIEQHLSDAAAANVAAGMTQDEAEREAVRRFGSPARIAADMRRNRNRGVSAFLSGVWLLAGVAVATLAVAYLASAVSISVLLRMHPEPSCPTSNAVVTYACSSTHAALSGSLSTALYAAAIALVVLVARWLARARLGLAAPARTLPYRPLS